MMNEQNRLIVEGQTRQLLDDVGLDHLNGTSKRLTQTLIELGEQTAESKEVALLDVERAIFPENGFMGLVVESNISVSSFCEHHLLPWTGKVLIAYQADSKVLGLSKLVRLVRIYSQGVTLQERMTDRVADWLGRKLTHKPIVVISTAVHTCMMARGVKEAEARTTVMTQRNNTGGEFSLLPYIDFLKSIQSVYDERIDP